MFLKKKNGGSVRQLSGRRGCGRWQAWRSSDIVSGLRLTGADFFPDSAETRRPANWDWILYLEAAGTTSNFTLPSKEGEHGSCTSAAAAVANETLAASSADVEQHSCSRRGGVAKTAWMMKARVLQR